MSDRSDPGFGPGTTDKRALLAELLRERAARPQQFPLSFSQQRLWFLEQLGDGGGAYHITAAWHARGPLDPAALEASLREVVRRQKSLRTTFATADGEPVQVVAPRSGSILPGIDLTALPGAVARAEAQRIATRLVYHRFDLGRGPLLRVALLHLGPAESVIALAMHHIIADGWSIGVLIRELATVYAAFAAGRPSPLPKLPVQYVDFVQWQRSWLHGDVLEAQLAYWKERLSPGGGVLELPTDRPRPAVQTFRGAGQPVALSPGLREELIRLGQREKATLFMVLLAAFKVLLHRYTGQDQVTAGSPIAYRNRRELEEVIGFFSNTLVVRTDLSGQPTFLELLARVRAGALGDLTHQDVPFEKLVEVLQPERDLSRTPLFQVAIALQNTPAPTVELTSLVLVPMEIERRSAKFDLTVELTEGPQGIAGTFDYNRDLFDRSRIQRAVGHFEVLLTGILADPGRRITEIPLLSTAEVAQVVLEWSDTDKDCPQRPLVHELFDLHAGEHPDAPAVASHEAVLTYGELSRRANRLAHHLQALGVGPDVLVAVCTDRTIDRVVGIVGVLKAGGAYVSIDPKHPRDRLAFLLEDARAPVLLTESRFLDRLPETTAEVLCLDTGWPAIVGSADRPPRTGVTPDNLSYVVYTSGSTGRPKGVEIPHAGLMNLVRWHSDLYAVRPGDRGTQVASPAFDASIWELWPYLASGASLHIPDEETRLSSAGMIRWWDEQGITLAYLMTPLAEGVLEEQIPPGLDLRVRALIIGGDRLHRGPDPEVGFRLMNHYGPAEYTVTSTVVEVPPRGEERGLPTIGRAIDNTRIYILDRSGQPVPVGVPGELYVAGIGLARGYLRRPGLTAEKFIPDPFAAARGEPGARMYRTADLVRWLPDGDMDFMGRLDHQVKVRGLRIELGEIETVLGQHPEVREVAVLVREDRPGDKRLVAYAVAVRELPPVAEDLRAFLREHLPEYMIPSAFVLLPALPLTPNGKVDRRALPAPEAEPEAFAAPRSPAEELVAQIFADLLQVGRVGLQSHFFELGGHSLLATRVVSRLREAAGVELPLRALFDAPTVGSLAGLVERGLHATAPLPALEPMHRDQPPPLSFAQQRLWWLDRLEPGSATYHVPAAVLLRGRLRPAALAAALGEVIRRHEALRTTFLLRADGDPVQVIVPAAPFPLPGLDLSALPEARAREELARLAREEARRPFNLARGPLLRLSLVILGEEEHAALMTLHHIVSDAWSVGLLVGELAALYGALLEGRPATLPELRVQYADFAIWQRGWLAGETLAAELAYWRERLEGAPPALELPTDRPRPAVRTSAGARLPLALPAPLPEVLRRFGLTHQTTLFMTLLAAFSSLLSRYAGQDDLSVGTPVAGRNHLGTEALIGCFVNTLVLRTRLAPLGSFADLLKEVRETTLSAYAHQDVPFEKLVEDLQPERNLGITPLFQVMLVLQNTPVAPAGFPRLEAEFLDVDSGAAKFDLTLSWLEADGALYGSLEYRPDLFDRATLQRLAGHFERLLGQALATPERPLVDLSLLTGPEAQQLLEWSGAGAAHPTDLCLHEGFARQAALAPDAVAVVCGGAALTYGALRARAGLLARRLHALGVGPDVPVAICAERSLDLVVGLLAIVEAGGAYLPLDPSNPPERLGFVLRDALGTVAAPVLLTQVRLTALLAASVLPDRLSLVLLDGDPETDAGPVRPAVRPLPDHLAYVIYTSGSTGRPKGTLITHRNAVRLFAATVAWLDFGPGDVWTMFHSSAFDFSVWEMWGALLHGGRLVVVPSEVSRSPESFLDLLWNEGVTILNQTPSAFRALVETEARTPRERELPLRWVIFGGEALGLASLSPWLERHGAEQPRLVNMYGITETTIHVTWRPIGRDDLRQPHRSPVGVPIPDLRIHLLGQDGAPVPAGIPGEIHVGGAGLARGYLGRPELTAERFVPDPGSGVRGEPGARLYRAGDLARYRPNGELDYLGRIDHQVKVRGFRIEPGEIEAALRRHPAVQECVVLARQDPPGESRLVAYVVSRSGDLGRTGLRELAKAHLPEYMVPAAFVFLPALPLTPNGKVDRRALPAPEREAATASAAPGSPVEEVLAGIFADVLKLDGVAAGDDFFELGGHSLLATQVLSRVRSAFGVELPLRQLFERPTVAALAEEVEAALRTGGAAPPPIEPVPRDRPLPLSFAQERLWFLDRLEPGGAAYNLPSAFLLEGHLDLPVLQAVLTEIVRRHEALRTTFSDTGSGPVQLIARPGPFPLPLVDLRGLPAELRPRESRRLAGEDAVRPFDLARGPLLRGTLIALAPEEHAILLNLHHVITDGWSMGVLVRELGALYDAFSASRPSPLLELGVQYADYAVWQRGWLSGATLEAELAWWRTELGGEPPVVDLPADHPRPAVFGHAGASRYLTVEAETSAGLRRLSRRQGATLFMTLLTGLQALLARYGAESGFAVGSPIAGRIHVLTEPLIGFFVNTLVLRSDLTGGPAFGEALSRARKITLDAYAHQDLPFERLVEELQPVRDQSRTPLFQVLMVLQNAPLAAIDLPGLRLLPQPVGMGRAKFDLTLGWREWQGDLEGVLEYRTDLFEPATILRMADHLRSLLRAAAAGPDRPVWDLPLLGDAERQQLLEWNATRTLDREDLCLHEWIGRQERHTPDAVAVVCGDEHLSHGELAARAGRLARRLRRLGVGPDVPVGICMDRSTALLVGLLGILRAGGAYVPLDPSYPDERLRFMLADALADAEVAVLLTRPDLADRFTLDRLHILCSASDGEMEEAGAADDPAEELGPDPDNLAYVIYTSGSTGRPKGVMNTHRAIGNRLVWGQRTYGLTAADRVLQKTPISFDVSIWELFWPLMTGACLVLARPEGHKDPRYLAEVIEEREITTLHFVPSMLHMFLEEPQLGLRCRSLRRAISSGEPLPPHLVSRFLAHVGRELHNLYGPTEAAVEVTSWRCRPDERIVPIGRPIANLEIHLLDRGLQPVAAGAAGELHIGGIGLARGYLGRPDLTAERFVPHAWSEKAGERLYRTGDLARWRPGGEIEYLGRIDHQVKVRGFRIELGEIEARLAEHPAVREAVVLAREDTPGEQRLVAYPVLRVQQSPMETSDLRSFLGQRLPEQMIPAAFVELQELPLLPNGKIDRRALPRPRPETSAQPMAPRNPVEEVLAGIFADLLGVDRVGPGDDFFALGGHSLLATRVVSRIREALGVELSLRYLFDHPKVAELAEEIAVLRADRRPAPPIEPVPRDRPLPLSFAQQRLWFLDRLDPGSAVYNMPGFVRLHGRLDVDALDRSLAALVERQEVLRTTFHDVSGEPAMAIVPRAAAPLPVIDLAAVPSGPRDTELRSLLDREAVLPFELSRGPLLRTLLFRLGAEEHALSLNIHHIVSDGWSTAILVREVADLYEAFRQGRPSPLPPLPVQYADFAVWQRQWLQGPVLEERLAYWRARLAGEAPALDLLTDFPRSLEHGYRSSHLSLRVPSPLADRVRALSRRQGATLFMTLLAAFGILLSRRGGQEDLVLGTPVAGRDYAALEKLVGLFLDTVVLRLDLSGAPGFLELLARVRETSLGAFMQRMPFDLLLNDLAPRRDLSRTPLFQVFFNLLSFPAQEIHLPDLRLEALSSPDIGAKFDLTLYAAESGEEIALTFSYNATLFRRESVQELGEQLVALLAQIVESPEVGVDHLSLWTAAAEAALPDPSALLAEPAFAVPGRLFLEQARGLPDAVAVCQGEVSLTYGELATRALEIARFLHGRGVASGSVVALSGPRCPELIAGVLGILLAGGALLLLDRRLPAARRRTLLTQSGTRHLLSLGPAGPDDAGLHEIPGLAVLRLPEFSRQGAGRGEPPVADPEPDAPAYVFFTSGTTGMPKAVLGRQRGLSHFLAWQRETFGIGPGGRVAQLTSLSFDVVLRDLFLPLTSGAALCLPDEEDLSPQRILPWMAASGVTALHTVPSLASVWLDAVPEGLRLPALRWVFFAGEPLFDSLVRRWRAGLSGVAGIVNLYGPTETTLAKCCFQVPDPPHPGVQPVGTPLPQTQALVLAAGGERLCGIGEAGEIVFRTPFRSLGYLNGPEEQSRRFRPNPFRDGDGEDLLYFTGDRGRYRSDGLLEILGRLDDQVKVRGMRVEPGEIRAALLRQIGVRDAAVVARQEGDGDAKLVAYLVSQPGTAFDGGEMRRRLQRELPDFMVPAAFVQLDALPLTPNGKLDRGALPAPVFPAGAAPGRPATPAEEILASLWAEILRVDRVGVQESFFELGGHSLLAIRLTSRVREALGVELPLREVFENPTVAALARTIEQAFGAGAGGTAPIVRAARDGDLPLSFAQQRLWFLDQLEPGNPTYNLPWAVRLVGRLDIAALCAALDEIVRRHEVLRTCFATRNGEPVQRIVPPAPAVWPLVDLRGLPAASSGPEVRRLAGEEARHPFDLACGPVLRGSVLAVAAEEHVSLLTVHHIASDGWSTGILVRELAALYQAFSAGLSSPLRELPIQYADFASWQRNVLSGETLAAEIAWWRGQLGDSPAALELPTDRPRPTVRTSAGARRPIRLPFPLLQELRILGRRQGTTLFMTVLAAFQTLLGRYSGQDDVTVGTPVAGRDRLETEDLIGFFVNMLVVPSDLGGNPAFTELLQRMKRATLEAYAHSSLPFEKLVDELQPKRDLSHTPLFQVVFQLQNEQPGVELPGLRLELLATDSGTSMFDLRLALGESAAGLTGFLEYDAHLFLAPTVDRLAAHFATLLAGVPCAPERRLSELPLLSEWEHAQILEEWNDTAARMPEAQLVHRLFEERAARAPGATAVVCRGEETSYGELNAAANRLAHHLRALGVSPGEKVAILLDRSAEMVLAVLGTLKAGAAYVPLETRAPQDRMLWILETLGVRMLLTGASRLAAASAMAPAAASLRHVICLDAPGPEVPSLPVPLGFSGPADRASLPASNPVPVCGADDPAYVIFTSGSTGRPKGVMVRHRPVINLIDWVNRTFAMTSSDRVLFTTSLGFDLSVYDVFGLLGAGGSIRVALQEEVDDPRSLVRILESEPVTFWDSAPAALAQLVPLLPEHAAGAALRLVFLSGDWVPLALPGQIRASFRGAQVVALGGATEATVWSNSFPVDEVDATWRSIPYGRPIQNARYYILDRSLHPSPVGAPGDLYIGGDCLATGYAGSPVQTAAQFVPDPWVERPGAVMYRTGDRARFRCDGIIEFLGRLDHQVKIRGFRIELGEIEAVLGEHAAVEKAVAVVREDQPGDRRIAAYVVPRVGARPAAEELRHLLRERLPEYMIPAALIFLDELPLTANGKVDRKALPAPERPPAVEVDGEPPQTPVEEVLAGLWCEILGVERIGRADDFFALGGHSLLATTLLARIRTVLGVEVPLRSIFEQPVLEDFAARVDLALTEQTGLSLSCIEPVDRSGILPLSFAQQRLWFLHQVDPASPAFNMRQAVLLEGDLDLAALARSLDEIVRRHETLRTSFRKIGNEPCQVVSPAEPVPLPVVDLQAAPPELAAAEVERLIGTVSRTPFDLSRGPLFRIALLRVAPRRSIAAFTIHHIVSDAWSMTVLIQELSALYRAFTCGQPSPLPELPVQYADFAAWQKRWWGREGAEALSAYWERRLAGAPPLLELPGVRPRPPVSAGRGRARDRVLLHPGTEELRTFARRASVTPFMVLLAAFDVLLHARTGAIDIVVGTDVANRTRAETEPLIGFFINQLALRTDLSGDPTFEELLGRVREVALGAYTHQDMPFDRLVEMLKVPRDPSYQPLFQVKMTMANVNLFRGELSGLTLSPVPARLDASQLDLNLRVAESGPQIVLSLQFDEALYPASLVDSLLEQLEGLLETVLERPEARLSVLAAQLGAKESARQAQRDESLNAALRGSLQGIRRRTAPERRS